MHVVFITVVATYSYSGYNKVYCNLCGRIKGFNRSITSILCQVGSYRTVVG